MALQTAASSMALGQRSTKIRPVMTNKKEFNRKNCSGKDREELQRQNINIDIYEENCSFKIKKRYCRIPFF